MPAICFQHLDRLAVEHCEVCKRPVCGSCLWYAESGERLCPNHAAEFQAQGKPVISPERYAAGITHSEVSAARPAGGREPYRGNSADVSALVAAVVGLMSLTLCAGLSWALPLLAFALSLISWLQAKEALDPRRTRRLAALAMAGGGLFMVVIAVGFLFFFLLFAFAMTMATRGGGFPTPFPLPTPTP